MKFSKEYEAELIARSMGKPVVPVAFTIVDEVAPAKQPRGQNKLEQAYDSHLEILKRAGEIVDYGFEAIKFKVGVKRCWYTVDFWVLAKDGVLECHETKGWMRDDARVKLQSAARQYQHFRFFLVRKDGKRFSVEAVK